MIGIIAESIACAIYENEQIIPFKLRRHLPFGDGVIAHSEPRKRDDRMLAVCIAKLRNVQ